MTYADLETLQEVVRAVRKAGAKVDASCGIHIHVDAARFDAAGLVRRTVSPDTRLGPAALTGTRYAFAPDHPDPLIHHAQALAERDAA